MLRLVDCLFFYTDCMFPGPTGMHYVARGFRVSLVWSRSIFISNEGVPQCQSLALLAIGMNRSVTT